MSDPNSHDPRLAKTAAWYGDRKADGGKRQRARRRRHPAVPITSHMLEGAPEFAPVPRERSRYDGWTYLRQRAFI